VRLLYNVISLEHFVANSFISGSTTRAKENLPKMYKSYKAENFCRILNSLSKMVERFLCLHGFHSFKKLSFINYKNLFPPSLSAEITRSQISKGTILTFSHWIQTYWLKSNLLTEIFYIQKVNGNLLNEIISCKFIIFHRVNYSLWMEIHTED